MVEVILVSIIYGDSGIMGKAELTYTHEIGNDVFNALQPYVYYDIGRTWLKDLPQNSGMKSIMNASSLGLVRALIFLIISLRSYH